MQLLFLVVILVVPYALLSLAGRFSASLDLDRRTRARVALSIFFAFTAVGHFIKTEAMVAMLPPWVPGRHQLVYVTGVLELLGAIGIWIPRFRRAAGLCLILMLIGLLPANIYAAFERVPFGGHELGPVYLLARVPVQLLLIAWTYYATEQAWLRRRSPLPH